MLMSQIQHKVIVEIYIFFWGGAFCHVSKGQKYESIKKAIDLIN